MAHLIYGIPSTINCANYAYFLALERVIKLNKPEAVKAFTGNTRAAFSKTACRDFALTILFVSDAQRSCSSCIAAKD